MFIAFRTEWLDEIHGTLRACLEGDNDRETWVDLQLNLYMVAKSNLGTERCKAAGRCIGAIDDALFTAHCEEAIRPIEAEPVAAGGQMELF